MERKLSPGEVTSAVFSLLFRDALVALGTIVALAAMVIVFDRIVPPYGANFVGIPISIVAFFATRRLIARQGVQSAQRAGSIVWFVLCSLVSSLGIVLGFFFLVLPGLYICVRWSMAGAALVEDLGPLAALGRSWEATRDHVVPITLALLLIFVPAIVAMAIMVTAGFVAGQRGTYDPTMVNTVMVIGNLLVYAGAVACWYLAVALYQLLAVPAETGLNEVFA
jgi:hypothetical protein